MSDLGLELHPRNVILFLQCVDKMIDAFDESELWAENQKAAFEKYRKGTACHYFPGAHGDLERLRTLSPDEILRLAATNGLI